MREERADTSRELSEPPRRRRWMGALGAPLILAACGAGPSPSPTVTAPTAAVTAPTVARTTARSSRPARTGSVAKPTPTDTDERSAIRALLPAGAIPRPEKERAAWVPRKPDGSTLNVYSVPYRLDGQPGVAAVLRQPPRLLWDLRQHPQLTDGLEAAWPVEMFRGAGLVVVRGGAAHALILDLVSDPAAVAYELPLPDDLELKTGSSDLTRAAYLTRDLTGDGLADPILEIDGRLMLYEDRPELGPRLIASAGPRDLLMDHDRDGLPELIAPAGPGEWTRRGWRDGEWRDLGALRHPDLPAPTSISAGDLPRLPGSLTYAMHSEHTVLRWPAQGGAPRTLWSGEDLALRGLRVSRERGLVLLAVAAGDSASDARLVLLAEGDEAHDIPTHGELRDFEISGDGSQVAYVGLGVDAMGGTLEAADGIEPLKRGTVFLADAGRLGEVRGIAPCEAVQAQPWWVVGCLGSVSLSSDGRQAAFGDGQALWVVDVDSGERGKLVEQFYVEIDGPGSRIYDPSSWSPDDRRLLAMVGGWEGGEPVIIDLDGGEPRKIPDAYIYGSTSEQAWSPGGETLLVTRWGANTEPSAEVRLVDAADAREHQPIIDIVPISEHRRLAGFGPAIAADDSVRFGLREYDDRWLANGVYRAERDGSGLRRLAALPPLTNDSDRRQREILEWSPDGDAFVVRFAEGIDDGTGMRTLVGLADGSALWDASVVLNDADWVTWSR